MTDQSSNQYIKTDFWIALHKCFSGFNQCRERKYKGKYSLGILVHKETEERIKGRQREETLSILHHNLQHHHRIEAELMMNHHSEKDSQPPQTDVHRSGPMYRSRHDDLYSQMTRTKSSESCQQTSSVVTSQEQGDADKPSLDGHQRFTHTLTPPGGVKERLTSVTTVTGDLTVQVSWRYTSVSTLERNHITVNCVTRVLVS